MHDVLVMLGLILVALLIIVVILLLMADGMRDCRSFLISIHDGLALDRAERKPPAGTPRHTHDWPPA